MARTKSTLRKVITKLGEGKFLVDTFVDGQQVQKRFVTHNELFYNMSEADLPMMEFKNGYLSGTI